MMIKDEHGEMHNVASNSKANAGLTTGIIGTALGGLSWLGGLGNGLGRSGAVATAEADEISKLRMENAILQADNATRNSWRCTKTLRGVIRRQETDWMPCVRS